MDDRKLKEAVEVLRHAKEKGERFGSSIDVVLNLAEKYLAGELVGRQTPKGDPDCEHEVKNTDCICEKCSACMHPDCIKPSSEISEDKLFQYISTLKSCFKNPNHYSLTDQTKIVEQDAVTLKKLIDEGEGK